MTTPVPTEGRKVLRVPKRMRARGDTILLAQAVWDLFQTLVEASRDSGELQVLGNWWDEHKHHLEAILRKERG